MGRELTSSERAALRRLVSTEDRTRKVHDDALSERDAYVRALRWGHPEVMPELICEETGLSRSTVHRIVGRKRDRPSSTNGAEHDGTNRT